MIQQLPSASKLFALFAVSFFLFSCTQNRMQLEEQAARMNRGAKTRTSTNEFTQYSDEESWDATNGLTEDEELLAHADDAEKNLFYDSPGDKDSNLMLDQMAMPSEELIQQGLAALHLDDEVNEQLMTDDLLAMLAQMEAAQGVSVIAEP